MILRVVNPLPRTIRDLVRPVDDGDSASARPCIACRTVELHADFTQLAEELEREFRTAGADSTVELLAARLPR